MSTSDKRKSTAHSSRPSASASSRNSHIIATPPRAQFNRSALTTSTSIPVDIDTAHEQQAKPVDRDSGGPQTAKEREKALHDKIAELKRELAANEAEFAHALDRMSQSESETAGYWETKYSHLNRRFLSVDTELRVLRTEVDVREAEKTELREEWEFLQRELSQRDEEIRSLRSQIAGLKQWVSTTTKKSDQTSDEELGEAIARLRNGLQNWAVSYFRKSSFGLSRAEPAIIEDLSQLIPVYDELAISETKAAFLQSIVSSILVDMIFDAYFVGLPEEHASQLSQIENYLLQLSSTEAVNEWRAMTLSMLRKECLPKLQKETDTVTEDVVGRANRILNSITDATATDARDQALRALVNNCIGLARLLVAQKAQFKVVMPKISPHQRILFEADTMDHIGEEDEDNLLSRELRCITFPGIVKMGDENGKHLQYCNVIAKATVLCHSE